MEFERLLSKYEYADVRIERSIGSLLRITDDEIRQSAGSTEGIGVRVLEKGGWGFASGNDCEDIHGLLEKAQKLARFGGGKIKIRRPNPGLGKITDRAQSVGIEEQTKELVEAAGGMKAKNVASRNVICMDSRVIKEFHSSDGADISQDASYTYLSCSCIAREGTNIQRGSERSWSRTGFGKIDRSAAERAMDKALRLLGAAPPPKGRFTVVLDPEMTGVLSHEAVGHACEADSVLDRESVLADKKGKRIGDELVTIVDDPTAKNFGSYVYDDEGVKAKKTTLIRDGIVTDFMNSMETARALDLELNGHSRAEDYEAVPVVRMSNTFFQKGKSSVDDVFDIKSGIYLKGMRGGSVDIFSGGFMFKAEESYEIRNGEKGRMMRDVTISGNILETLLNVEIVGKDFGTSPGMCGKFSQEVPVSDGGPHIRVKDMVIG